MWQWRTVLGLAVLASSFGYFGCSGPANGQLEPARVGDAASPDGSDANGDGASGAGGTDAGVATGPTGAILPSDRGAAGSGAAPEPAPDPLDPRAPIPVQCQGFPLAGLRYSPGGATLPNQCAPFHATWNNPYAVRCIDAIAGFDSGFPGDEYCVLPPPPDRGIQIGFHPQGGSDAYWEQLWAGDMSGYAHPPEAWVLEPGDERTENFRGHAGNADAERYYRTYFRMRTGSHHGIYALHRASGKPEGWDPEYGELSTLVGELTTLLQNLGGQQRLDDNLPPTLEKPPEDAELYFEWPANPEVMINVHSFNSTDESVLREGWTNLWWEREGTTRAGWYVGLDPLQIAALEIRPGEIADYHYVFDAMEAARLMSVMGHRHVWTTELVAWIERDVPGRNPVEAIYRSLDWADVPTFRFDSATQNPPIANAEADGAASGVVELARGDKLHFNCHVEYTDERAAAIGSPQLPSEIGPLYFENAAFTAEMCALFGAVTEEPFFTPVLATSAVPDFSTTD